MDWEAIRREARSKFKGYCRVCKECNGRACAGEVPGMGGAGSGNSFIDNIEALKEIKVNLRVIHGAKEPDTSIELFGQILQLPVLAAPMTGISYNMGGAVSEEEFIRSIVEGSIEAGTIAMTGDGADPAMYDSGVSAVKRAGGKGIPIIKPREQQEIFKYISKAEEAGALAVGMDIDGAGLITMALKGQPVGPKTPEELKEIISSTKLPFIVKGIMTPDEAENAVKSGASAIVVSNHGGRILDSMPGAARVLAEIVNAVGDEVIIFADGGVRSGVDVLKYLALGADAVLVGRPLAVAVFGGGTEGVSFYLKKLKEELVQAMILTGCASLRDVGPKIIFTKDSI
ncbi:MAG TPA: alpha-hydroxy-acid oxidizing enzyme [Peptococcaceae bacterium]|nr:MAG: (S)-2-hydroxy-acid oxidase [Clostridia bacterium 41_269]HBT19864.1 alpha-hydroxy-acid oxidizing enzyme [Peptococcaceae bacterium]